MYSRRCENGMASNAASASGSSWSAICRSWGTAVSVMCFPRGPVGICTRRRGNAARPRFGARAVSGGDRGLVLGAHRRQGRRRHHRGRHHDRAPAERSRLPAIPPRGLAVAHPRRAQLRHRARAPPAYRRHARPHQRPHRSHRGDPGQARMAPQAAAHHGVRQRVDPRPAAAVHGPPVPHRHPREDHPRAGGRAAGDAQHRHPRRPVQGDRHPVDGARGRHHAVSAQTDRAQPQGGAAGLRPRHREAPRRPPRRRPPARL